MSSSSCGELGFSFIITLCCAAGLACIVRPTAAAAAVCCTMPQDYLEGEHDLKNLVTLSVLRNLGATKSALGQRHWIISHVFSCEASRFWARWVLGTRAAHT